ncbi:MAG TPA: lysine 2,3-aminomutase [Ruminococcaceae bacterium]|nr:lysine 2,3-aminomutase [Oscillospiraceae bacterium]
MDENRRLSLQRSNELHAYGQDFLSRKKNIPLGLNEPYMGQYELMKAKILKELGGSGADWDDWQWQMRNRIDSHELLDRLITLSEEDRREIDDVSRKYRWAITPYYLALIDPENSADAIRGMSVPCTQELAESGLADPSGEENTNPAGIITRRYPDRLILNVTNSCSTFCRHCQRRRNIGQTDTDAHSAKIDESLEYIRQNTELRDILITGGDPLVLSDDFIEDIVARVRVIPHVEIIRIGSRTPVTMPQRITPELVGRLKKYHPVFMNTQFNHPREITPQSKRACELLRDNGFMLGNQMVLLGGINDDEYVVRLLNQELLKIGVRPYYMFYAKNVVGTLHFRTSVRRGVEILEYLQGNTSGMAIPHYIVSAPDGLGKIPLGPEYIVGEDDEYITLRTWEDREVKIKK